MLLKHPDFDALRDAVCAAARQSFLTARATHPNDTFFAFVLSIYGTGSLGGCAVNTFENHERVWRQAREQQGARPQDENYYKWFCGEWGDCEFFGDHTHFNDAWGRYHQALETLQTLLRELGEDPSDAWHWGDDNALYAALVDALTRLDEEGVFGVGEARQKALVYITEYDGRDEVISSSIERLNPHAPSPLKRDATSWLQPGSFE